MLFIALSDCDGSLRGHCEMLAAALIQLVSYLTMFLHFNWLSIQYVGAMFASNRLSGTASCCFVNFKKRLAKKKVTQPLQPPYENCTLVPGQGEAFSFHCIASSWIVVC